MRDTEIYKQMAHNNDNCPPDEDDYDTESQDTFHNREYKENEFFIGGIYPKTHKRDVKNYLAQFGEIKECRLMRYKNNKRFRGFGFISFNSLNPGVDLEKIDHELNGHKIQIKKALTKEATKSILLEERDRKVYVSNLDPNTQEAEIKEYFSQYGDVESVKLIREKITNKSRGFAFVLFENKQQVIALLEAKLKHSIAGKDIQVDQSVCGEDSSTKLPAPAEDESQDSSLLSSFTSESNSLYSKDNGGSVLPNFYGNQNMQNPRPTEKKSNLTTAPKKLKLPQSGHQGGVLVTPTILEKMVQEQVNQQLAKIGMNTAPYNQQNAFPGAANPNSYSPGYPPGMMPYHHPPHGYHAYHPQAPYYGYPAPHPNFPAGYPPMHGMAPPGQYPPYYGPQQGGFPGYPQPNPNYCSGFPTQPLGSWQSGFPEGQHSMSQSTNTHSDAHNKDPSHTDKGKGSEKHEGKELLNALDMDEEEEGLLNYLQPDIEQGDVEQVCKKKLSDVKQTSPHVVSEFAHIESKPKVLPEKFGIFSKALNFSKKALEDIMLQTCYQDDNPPETVKTTVAQQPKTNTEISKPLK